MNRILASIVLVLMLHAPSFAQTGRGVIVGQIRWTGGRPAAGVRVMAVETKSGSSMPAGTALLASISQTDSDGRYRLEDIPPGRYYIAAGHIDSPTYFPGAITTRNARTIAVAAGSTLQGIDFSMAAPVKVTGHVIAFDESAVEAAGVTIRLVPAPRKAPIDPPVGRPLAAVDIPLRIPQLLASVIAGDGSFTFTDVPPGDYVVSALGREIAVMVPFTAATGAPDGVRVADRDITDIAISFARPVQGRVVMEQGAQPASFTLTFTDFRRTPIRAFASSDGSFQASLIMGDYWIEVSGLPSDYVVQSIMYGSMDALHAQLTIGRVIGEIVVKLGVKR